MSYSGGAPTNPGDPNNPQSYPQQPGYPPQQPGYPPQQPGSGYGQQPPPYQPAAYNQMPQNPQQPPKKKSNRGLIIGCSIAAVIVLLVCGGGAVLAATLGIGGIHLLGSAVNSAATAATVDSAVELAAQQFCTDVTTQDYTSAYGLLSSSAKSQVTQAKFTSQAQALDTSAGTVSTCTPGEGLPSISADGNTATVPLSVARSGTSTPAGGNMTMVFENGAWLVDSTDANLNLP